jgi:hypothetical protein
VAERNRSFCASWRTRGEEAASLHQPKMDGAQGMSWAGSYRHHLAIVAKSMEPDM